MQNFDTDKLKEAVENFNNLDKENQSNIKWEIVKNWNDITQEFQKICEQDVELQEDIKKLDKINNILTFNIKEVFIEYDYTANEGDPEFEQDIYKFSEQELDMSKYLAVNWENIEKEYAEKINGLKNRKLVIFRKKRIEHMEELYDAMKERADLYNRSKAILEKQKYYKENKEIPENLEKSINEKLTKYARNYLVEKLKDNPNLICVEHGEVGRYKVLPTLCNSLRKEIITLVQQQASEQISKPENKERTNTETLER